METKSNKAMIISLVILSLLVFGLGGYVVYDKVLLDEPQTTNNNMSDENNSEEENVSSNTQILNENLVINLSNDENDKLFNIFDNIISRAGYIEKKAFTFFDEDYIIAYVLMTSDILSDRFVPNGVELTCYSFKEINDLSEKVFRQGINANAISDYFNNTSCPTNYIGLPDGGTVKFDRKIKQLRLNEKTKIYTLEIISIDYESEDVKNAFYEFEFKIDNGVLLKNIRLNDLSALTGKRLS